MRRRPVKQREEAIRLREEERMSYQAIADELNVPRDTVKSWYRRHTIKNGIPIDKEYLCGMPVRIASKKNKNLSTRDYEKRIKQLEMEVELLRDFLSAAGRRSIKK